MSYVALLGEMSHLFVKSVRVGHLFMLEFFIFVTHLDYYFVPLSSMSASSSLPLLPQLCLFPMSYMDQHKI